MGFAFRRGGRRGEQRGEVLGFEKALGGTEAGLGLGNARTAQVWRVGRREYVWGRAADRPRMALERTDRDPCREGKARSGAVLHRLWS